MASDSKNRVGGGTKKVLYTLQTAQRMGLVNSAKALASHNACKACGLGMGGQRGGMTNELDEFPSVCNKSVQAQSTDIQPPIPADVFQHTLSDFRELSGSEMERLGRLGQPLHKAPGADRFKEVSWSFAIERTVARLRAITPSRSFFYSSGRSSNEAGFLLQLLARMYGTNNISNCSYYCHQATSEALSTTVGTGTATVELDDLSGCDLVFLIGANPASNHPRLLHKLIELRRRGGHVVVINPMREPGLVRFAAPKLLSSLIKGGDEVASIYLQPRTGADIALFTALAKAVHAQGGVHETFVKSHTSSFPEFAAHLEQASWPALTARSGVSREQVEAVASLYCRSDNVIFAWGMGMTHHQHGVENIEWISNLALMRAMVGKRHAGLLPLRGHSNVQGIGTIGVKPVLPEAVFTSMEDAFGVSLPRGPGQHTLESLSAAHAGEMDAAILLGGNLYEATPDTQWARDALDRVDFKLFLTTTLNRGHVNGIDAGESIVLPVCARDEEPEPTTQESMFNYVRLSDGGIERIANARAESAVLADIAAGLLPDAPVDFSEFRGHQQIRQAIARVVPGMEDLQSIDVAKREFHVRGRVLHTPQFHTEDGLARFVVPAAPGYEPAPGTFTLLTMRSEGQFNSIVYEEEDTYRGSTSRWTVFMNAQDAAAMSVAEGDRVNLTTEQGTMAGVSVVFFDIPRGCAAAYYPEANVLASRASDPRSHTPRFKSIPVAISPV